MNKNKDLFNLNDLKKEIDSWPLHDSRFFIDHKDYTDIVKWSTDSLRRYLICA